jgi:hypothetical protein
LLEQKQIKQRVKTLPELDGGFGLRDQSLNAALGSVILAEIQLKNRKACRRCQSGHGDI